MKRERVLYLEADDSEEKVSLLKSNNDSEPMVESNFENISANTGWGDFAAEHESSIPMVPVRTSEEDEESKKHVVEVEEKVDEEDEKANLLGESPQTDNQEVQEQESWIRRKLSGWDQRKLGLALNLLLTTTTFTFMLFPSKKNYSKRAVTLVTLFSFLGTLIWLYAYELIYGLGLVFFQNPALPWTIKETTGMWIGNVGFGITFSFGIIAKANSEGGVRPWCLVLWWFMAIAVAFIVYYPLNEEKKHNAAIVGFVILLTFTLFAEEAASPVIVGWFQLALCFIFVGVFVLLVEKAFRAKKVKTCSPGLYRNQLYIIFSFIFYLIGLVARAFRTTG